MNQQPSVQELLRAIEPDDLDGESLSDQTEINLALIIRLKKRVDYLVRSDLQQAARLADLTHRLSTHTADPLAHALGIRARAQTLHYQARYEDAIEWYRAAARIYQSLAQPVEAARIARSMIDPLLYLGRYDEALRLGDEARAVLNAHDEKLLSAQLDVNVGNVYHRLDQYQQALDCYHRARDVFSSLGDQSALAIASLNCANIYSSLDDFRQAQEAYRLTYELCRTQQMHLVAAQARYSLGYLHFLKGEYHQAMRVLHEVSEEFTRLGDARMAALCLLDLAEIYLQLNVLDEAAGLAAQARERFESLGIRYEAAKALTWLGLARLHQARLDEAEESLRAAQTEFSQESNEVWLGLLDLYLAELALKRSQADEALSLATEAGELFSRLSLKAKTCSAWLVMARALSLSQGQREAGQLCRQMLESARGLEAPWLAEQAHELLGDLCLSEGSSQQASEHYSQAIGFIEQIRGNIRVDEFRSTFFQDKLRVYEKLIRLCLQQGGPDKQAEAFFYLESRKARTLVDLIINELKVVPSDAGSGELLQRWQQLREELHWFYSRLNQNEADGKSRRLGAAQKLQQEISVRERALAEVVRQAQIQQADFVRQQNFAGMTVDELRALLAEDEAVIEYYLDGDELRIFVIDRARLEVVHSRSRREELKELILELRFHLDKFRYGQQYIDAHLPALRHSTDACLHELYQGLFAPVASLVAGRKLIFIPFDLLHNVPFQALFDGESYLLDRHEVACAPSARLLALCARTRPRPGQQVLIVGAADETAPQINEEIRAIRRLFPAAHCLTGEAANARALAEYLPASDIVHIASHAVFRQDNPMFSAFRLADTWLNFYDVCTLRIPAALVTLSGCSTGANGIYAGDEMLGLVRGFLTAGATALVVSLWAVNDPATARLMTAFYEQLQQGCPPRQALRAAALYLREEYAHPYYWAPFVFIGHRLSGFSALP
jgi:CHAT domain-containing protein/predicted negative regulator of RcsB-dependent stress response